MNNIIKRIIDVLASFISIIFLFPVFIILAIAVKLDSKGPVIFKQTRLGINGRHFNMYKFRSMVLNAQNMGTGIFNYKDDPRVTKVGRFLRNTSLDEIPQLFNVLKGDMSLVGPRPAVVNELGDFETLNKRYKARFMVKPGITGLAQVSGRNELPWDQKVDFDNEYIKKFKKYGVIFDTMIILKTIIKIFSHHDICEEKIDDDEIISSRLAEQEIIRKAHEKCDVSI